MLILVCFLIFLLVNNEYVLHFGECVFIYVSHLASGVIVKPKYLNVPSCFILSSLQRMLHTCTGMSDCFQITIHSVFFAFSWSPLFSLSTVSPLKGYLAVLLPGRRVKLCLIYMCDLCLIF